MKEAEPGPQLPTSGKVGDEWSTEMVNLAHLVQHHWMLLLISCCYIGRLQDRDAQFDLKL